MHPTVLKFLSRGLEAEQEVRQAHYVAHRRELLAATVAWQKTHPEKVGAYRDKAKAERKRRREEHYSSRPFVEWHISSVMFFLRGVVARWEAEKKHNREFMRGWFEKNRAVEAPKKAARACARFAVRRVEEAPHPETWSLPVWRFIVSAGEAELQERG